MPLAMSMGDSCRDNANPSCDLLVSPFQLTVYFVGTRGSFAERRTPDERVVIVDKLFGRQGNPSPPERPFGGLLMRAIRGSLRDEQSTGR
jgi:hypothetical protein